MLSKLFKNDIGCRETHAEKVETHAKHSTPYDKKKRSFKIGHERFGESLNIYNVILINHMKCALVAIL